MTAQETFGANFFETTVTVEVGATDLTANVAATTGLSVPCYVVFAPDVPARREIWLVDSSITATTLVASNINKRYLSGSAAGSGIVHPIGEVVRFASVMQHWTDVNDRIDGTITKASFTAANQLLAGTGAGTFSPLDVAASRLVGRTAAGSLDDLSVTDVKTLLALASADISDLAEFIRDTMGTALVAGSNITLTVNDAGDTITVAASAPALGSFVGASAYKSGASQSIPTATWTAITFDLEDFDSDGFHSTAVNTSRFTVPAGKAGKYLVVGRAEFAANATGWRVIGLWLNGASNFAKVTAPTASGTVVTGLEVSGVVNLAVGDYVEVQVHQNSGGAIDVSTGQSATSAAVSFLGA